MIREIQAYRVSACQAQCKLRQIKERSQDAMILFKEFLQHTRPGLFICDELAQTVEQLWGQVHNNIGFMNRMWLLSGFKEGLETNTEWRYSDKGFRYFLYRQLLRYLDNPATLEQATALEISRLFRLHFGAEAVQAFAREYNIPDYLISPPDELMVAPESEAHHYDQQYVHRLDLLLKQRPQPTEPKPEVDFKNTEKLHSQHRQAKRHADHVSQRYHPFGLYLSSGCPATSCALFVNCLTLQKQLIKELKPIRASMNLRGNIPGLLSDCLRRAFDYQTMGEFEHQLGRSVWEGVGQNFRIDLNSLYASLHEQEKNLPRCLLTGEQWQQLPIQEASVFITEFHRRFQRGWMPVTEPPEPATTAGVRRRRRAGHSHTSECKPATPGAD